MARPKHEDPADFVVSEVMEATGWDRRTVQLIRDRRAGPFGEASVLERAKLGLYDEDAVAELAMASGIHGGGFPLLQSVSIARAYLEENPPHGAAVFSNIRAFLDIRMSREIETWFQAACLTREERGGRDSGVPKSGDEVIVIADRKYVLEEQYEPLLTRVVPEGVDFRLPSPLCRIVSLDANVADVVSVPDDFDAGSDYDFKGAYEVYHKALHRAVAISRVNISLAIRNAFDRVQDMRFLKGGPLFAKGGV